MNDYFYPAVHKELELMLQMQAQDPDYILGGGYGREIEALFLGQKVTSTAVSAPVEGEMSKWERLEFESDRLFSALTDAGSALGNRDNAEKLSYFRVATSLLDKVVGIQERVLNIKRLGLFQQTVIKIMEEQFDGEQRVEVRRRLEEAGRGE